MSGFYTLAYAAGFRPWEQAGRQAAAEFSGLLDRETSQRPAPPGRAADLGCGTGATPSSSPTGAGRQPASTTSPGRRGSPGPAPPHARPMSPFARGDVTALQPGDIGGAADFFLDVGCFHHLPGPARQAMATAVTAAAAPAAPRRHLGPGPAGPGELIHVGGDAVDDRRHPGQVDGHDGPVRPVGGRAQVDRRRVAAPSSCRS